MTPAEARALYWEARASQHAKVAPILAEVRGIIDGGRTDQFRHRKTSGVPTVCPPGKEGPLRKAAKKAPSMNALARTMGWSPRTTAKHCARLGIQLGMAQPLHQPPEAG